jgi:hypothetical protein
MTLDPFGNLMMSQTLFLDVDSIFFHDIILKKKEFSLFMACETNLDHL